MIVQHIWGRRVWNQLFSARNTVLPVDRQDLRWYRIPLRCVQSHLACRTHLLEHMSALAFFLLTRKPARPTKPRMTNVTCLHRAKPLPSAVQCKASEVSRSGACGGVSVPRSAAECSKMISRN